MLFLYDRKALSANAKCVLGEKYADANICTQGRGSTGEGKPFVTGNFKTCIFSSDDYYNKQTHKQTNANK